MTHPVLIRPACLDRVNGDIIVAMLLSQIVYWSLPGKNGQSKLRIVRDGVYWIAKTRTEWMDETGLTLERYKRAIALLKSRSLVEVRVMRFRGIAQTHVRLLHPVATYHQGAPEADPPTTVVDNPPTGWCVSPRPITETTAESTQSVRVRTKMCQYDDDGRKPPRGEGRRSEEEHYSRPQPLRVKNSYDVCQASGQSKFLRGSQMKERKTRRPAMKAHEILASHQQGTTGSLGAWWLSRCALHQKGYQQALTGQQMGQLKQLRAYLGDDAKPLITFVVENWWKFASRAAASAGTSFPADPHIGFLLKHHAVAVNLLSLSHGATLLPVEPVVGKTVVQSIATGVENEPVHTLTSQELTELLEGLQSP